MRSITEKEEKEKKCKDGSFRIGKKIIYWELCWTVKNAPSKIDHKSKNKKRN